MPTPTPTQIVVVGAHDIEAASIRRQLEGVADLEVSVVEADAALAAIRDRRPALVLIVLDHDREAMTALARAVTAVAVPSVIVSRDRDPDTILLAMRSGARDFAYLESDDSDVRRAVTAIITAPAPGAQPAHRGTIIAVFGCKGGCGATMLATNLAATLLSADERRRVVVVDVDTQMGDVLTFLDVAPTYSWTDLLRNLPRLDDDLVHRSLTAHASGLRIVAPGGDVEEADLITGEAVTKTLAFLRQHYDYIVVDGIRDFRDTALAALDAADRIAVTMTQDVPALKNASRCLAVFQRLGYGPEKVRLVVNRFHKRARLDQDTISDALGRGIDATIANDYPVVVRAINEGQLLAQTAPHADVTGDIRSLLPALDLTPVEEKQRHWFRRRR